MTTTVEQAADRGSLLRPLAQKIRRSLDSFGEVFRSRDLRYLELALGLNAAAENAYLVALAVYAYDVGGATAVGLVGLIRMVPAGIAGLFGSVIADRYRREWLLRVLYAARALSAGATALAFFAGAPAAVVFVLAVAFNICAVLLRPAYWALLPDLARTPEQLVACNVVASIFEGLAWLAGPAAAAILIEVASPGVTFVAAGVTLLAAAGYSARVRADHIVRKRPTDRHVLGETLAGVRTVARDRHARVLFGLFGAQTIVRGALNVLVVVAAIEFLGMGEPGVGWLNSAFGVGGLVGAVVSLTLVGRRRLALPFGVGLILWGLPIALVALWMNPVFALIMLGIPGMGNAVLDVAGLTMLQRIIPNNVLGRVFGALEAQVFATVGAGSLLASGLIVWLGFRGALLATGLSLPALALMAWPRLRAIDRATVVPERELALLRGIPMFAALPAVALEHVAANLEPVSVAARSVVFREGDDGDRFYVIAGGDADVWCGRKITARLGAGDYFGEIALVRGVPRTATVKARSDVELFALASEPFLAAVSGNALATVAADRVVADRMATVPAPSPPKASAAPAPKRRTASPPKRRIATARKRRVATASKRRVAPAPKSRGARKVSRTR